LKSAQRDDGLGKADAVLLERQFGIVDPITAVSVSIQDVVEPILHVFDGLARGPSQHASQRQVLVVEKLRSKATASNSRNDFQVSGRHLERARDDKPDSSVEI
jgi:hypothetical protein